MDDNKTLNALDVHFRLAALDQELRDVHDKVFELLDELDVVEILRAHVPTHHRWLLDRLELALRRIDFLDQAIADAESVEAWEQEHAGLNVGSGLL
jgi:hypothetical protein